MMHDAGERWARWAMILFLCVHASFLSGTIPTLARSCGEAIWGVDRGYFSSEDIKEDTVHMGTRIVHMGRTDWR